MAADASSQTGATAVQTQTSDNAPETLIHEDDQCPICHLLICDPITTICGHTTCRSCMVQWADTSPRVAEKVEIDVVPGELEAKCPLCRTKTAGSKDAKRAAILQKRYPDVYAQRKLEEDEAIDPTIEYLTMHVGNTHELGCERPEGSANTHFWTFFVRTSRDEIIHSVFIHLHPTFRPSHVLLDKPPFEIKRRGWGSFCVQTTIILERGWVWVTDSSTFEHKKIVRTHWPLEFEEFEGTGAMHKHRFKYRAERPEDRALWDLELQRFHEEDEDDAELLRGLSAAEDEANEETNEDRTQRNGEDANNGGGSELDSSYDGDVDMTDIGSDDSDDSDDETYPHDEEEQWDEEEDDDDDDDEEDSDDSEVAYISAGALHQCAEVERQILRTL